MNLVVRWQDHNREYSLPLARFFELAKINYTDAQAKQIVKKLLEQNEMDRV